MTSHQVHERLRYNILFEDLADGEFDRLFPLLEERRFTTGDVIIEDGADEDGLFLLLDGRVKVVKKMKDGSEKMMALLHEGDFFGELELIDGRPRAAQVAAVEPCITYVLTRQVFGEMTQTKSAFTHRLLYALSVRLRAANNHFLWELARYAAQRDAELGKLQKLIEASRTLNSTLNLDELLTIILKTTLEIVDADRGTVYLLDEAHQELWSRILIAEEKIDIRLPLGKGIAGYVAATGDTLNIENAYLDARFNPDFDRLTGYHTESILCMPMKNNQEKTIGVVQLLNKHKGPFTSEDESFLGALSVHAAIALENARLYEQEKQKIAMEKELIAAREVQFSLIPKELPTLPGFDFAASFVPAREIAGDLYDFIPLENGKLVMCLGDVAGKGLPASLLMSNVQATLHDLATIHPAPKDCLSRTNTLLAQRTGPEKFVTLFFAVISPGDGLLRYCNAGHESPLIVRPSGEVHRLEAGGIPLGMVEEFPFQDGAAVLAPGDVLAVFSDGVTESMNTSGDQFGPDRLLAILQRCRNESATSILREIEHAVKQHAGETRQMDDMTMVVVKRLSA
jgi:sigma-B regulation protein RsbU (phosphoserine phosphatase)